MNSKEYTFTDGRTAVFEYDENGIGKITLECVDALMGRITQQWIPCSERLPEYADFYLTSTEHNSVYCDFYDGYRFQRTEKVIAWMPLPEPYKENEP